MERRKFLAALGAAVVVPALPAAEPDGDKLIQDLFAQGATIEAEIVPKDVRMGPPDFFEFKIAGLIFTMEDGRQYRASVDDLSSLRIKLLDFPRPK